MSQYASTATVEQVAERLAAAQRVLLTTHVKPDGDGMGSALALWRVLRARGAEAEIHLLGPLEPRLRDVAGETPYRVSDRPPPRDDYDLLVVLDTGSWRQLEPLADWLRERRDRVLVIDHHARGDDVSELRLVDSTAASTTQMLVPVIEAMGGRITGGAGGVAEALFVGLATDTGWFRFPSAGPQVLRVAAELLERGVDKSRLYQLIEETYRPQRLALAARALASLELVQDGAVAVMTLGPDDFKECGGSVQDISELVNMPMVVRSVRVSVLLAETSPGRTKLSFRSKPHAGGAADGGAPLDMNLLAQQFGGGGHVHAAGAHMDAAAAKAREALLAALESRAVNS